VARVSFTSALQRFLAAPPAQVEGRTVGAALAVVFASRLALRGYVLDDQGTLRRHVAVYVNGQPVAWTTVQPGSHVMLTQGQLVELRDGSYMLVQTPGTVVTTPGVRQTLYGRVTDVDRNEIRVKTSDESFEVKLKDPKAAAFTENFVGQWLGLREIDATIPSHILYPEYDEMLKHSMLRETYLFFDEVLRHDLSLTNFVASDFTMLNERLAAHYGLPPVQGVALRRTPEGQLIVLTREQGTHPGAPLFAFGPIAHDVARPRIAHRELQLGRQRRGIDREVMVEVADAHSLVAHLERELVSAEHILE